MSIMRMPGPTQGVQSPYIAHVHPYPTRFHGTLGRHRITAGLPFIHQPSSYFQNRVLHRQSFQGLGADMDVGQGVFRPTGEGGGIFANSISGYGALGALTVDQAKLRVAAAAAEMSAAVGSGNQTRIAAATYELNVASSLLNEANAAAGQSAADKAAAVAQKKSGGGGSTFIAPPPLTTQPLPTTFTSGGMSPGAKAALYGGGAALLLAVGYYVMTKK